MVYGIVVLFIHSRKRRKKNIISFQFHTHKYMIDICEHVYLSIVSNTQSFHSQSPLIYLGEYRKRKKRRLKAIKCVFSTQKVACSLLELKSSTKCKLLTVILSYPHDSLSLYTLRTSRECEQNIESVWSEWEIIHGFPFVFHKWKKKRLKHEVAACRQTHWKEYISNAIAVSLFMKTYARSLIFILAMVRSILTFRINFFCQWNRSKFFANFVREIKANINCRLCNTSFLEFARDIHHSCLCDIYEWV